MSTLTIIAFIIGNITGILFMSGWQIKKRTKSRSIPTKEE